MKKKSYITRPRARDEDMNECGRSMIRYIYCVEVRSCIKSSTGACAQHDNRSRCRDSIYIDFLFGT